MLASGGPLIIGLSQLREAVNGLISQLEAERGPRVEVDRDHYWLVELRSAFQPELSSAPGDLGVGQLSDDIESVNQTVGTLRAGDRVPAVWHDLEHATGLLRALAWLDLR